MRFALAVVLYGLTLPTVAADCLLEVDGTKYIDGPCQYEALDGRDFKIGIYPEAGAAPMRFAYVYVDEAGATGFWNGQPAETHAHESLGDLRKSGECWVNAMAKICVSQ